MAQVFTIQLLSFKLISVNLVDLLYTRINGHIRKVIKYKNNSFFKDNTSYKDSFTENPEFRDNDRLSISIKNDHSSASDWTGDFDCYEISLFSC